MKVKYCGEYDFISGLSYGDLIDVEYDHETYVNGLTKSGRRVVVEKNKVERIVK